jgi:hypothetical protein
MDFFSRAFTLYQASEDLFPLFNVGKESKNVEEFVHRNLDEIKKHQSWHIVEFAKFLQEFNFVTLDKFDKVLKNYITRAKSLTTDEYFKNEVEIALATFKAELEKLKSSQS